MRHVVVQRAEQRSRKRQFLAQIERASNEALATCLANLDSADELSAFGAWQFRAMSNELEMRA